MKRKLLAMLLCVALAAGLFGTLAVAAEENVAQPTPDTPTCTCKAEEGAPHAVDCPLYEKDETKAEPPVCTCNTEDDNHAEDCPLYEKDETKAEPPVCTCNTEDDNHAVDCPCYVEKDETKDETKEETKDETKDETEEEVKEEPPVCDCGAEDDNHKETCPCYVAPTPVVPEAPAPQQNPDHLDTCSEDCTREDCACLCHLVKKLVASETLEEFCALLAQMTEEQLLSLTREQYGKIEARLTELCTALVATLQTAEPEPVASAPAGDSEVVTPTVNFTNVAPFGAPVTG